MSTQISNQHRATRRGRFRILAAALLGLLAAGTAQAQALKTSQSPNNGIGDSGSVFFNLSGAESILISGFDIFTSDPAGTNSSYYVYTYNGGYGGRDASSSGWVYRGYMFGVSNGPTVPTSLALPTPIALDAGRTLGVCLYSIDGGIRYRNASESYSNDELTFAGGRSRNGWFGGDLFTPRAFCGAIRYNTFGGPLQDSYAGRAVVNVGDVNNDGHDDIAVGMPGYDGRRGRVDVYSANGGLLHSFTGEAAGDRFGRAVAGGDLNDDGHSDIIVGAAWNDNRAANAGMVRFYSGADGSLMRTKRGYRAGDRFGFSVASGIDVNNDGHDDVIVGAPYSDVGGSNAGRVYIYSGRNFRRLGMPRGERRGDRFGFAVAGVGRGSGGHYDDFVVSAPYNDERGSNAGKVYMFEGRDLEVRFTKIGARRGDTFGFSLAGLGRVDGDGRDDFAVGAPFFDPSSSRKNAGRVYAFSGRDGDRLWKKNGKRADDRLGYAVGSAGDVNGDGRADAIAGAPRYDQTAAGLVNNGRVYVFSGDAGRYLESFLGDESGDFLGIAVTGMGDLFHDGRHHLLIGAHLANTYGSNSGAAYLRPSAFGARSAAMPLAGGPGLESDEIEPIESGSSNERSAEASSGTSHTVLETGEKPAVSDAELSAGSETALDILTVLASWGACEGCPADLNGDGVVDDTDLQLVLER